MGLIPGSGGSPGVGNGNLLQYSCLENTQGQRSLVGYSPRGCKESDMTETTEYSIHIVDICQSQSYHLSLRPFPLGNHKFVFYICDLISVL